MKEIIREVLQKSDWLDKKIVVAVSGGLDSMVLADILRQLDVHIIIAHCNFGLRGAESEGDEAFVRNWADKHQLVCHVQHFDTPAILAREGGNLQEVARNLRYEWFETLRADSTFDLIATAHHAGDSVETLLINLLKGTGISGLHGILPRQGNIIRPILALNREDIQRWAKEQQLSWREDSSNAKDNYTRNAIRHHLLPAMEQILPGSVENLRKSTERFREAELLYQESIERYRKKLLEQRRSDWYIPLRKLQHCRPLSTILWELLKPFGFSPHQLPDIQQLMHTESGRYVASESYRVIRHREFLVITALATAASTHVLVTDGQCTVDADDFSLQIKKGEWEDSLLNKVKTSGKTSAFIDMARLAFPLTIRPWKTGDYFYPMGMGMKKKKVSRFLIGEKLGIHEKEKVWVLESKGKIVWLIGQRIDERFKLRSSTRQYVQFTLNDR